MKLTYIVSGIKKSVFFENTALALRNIGYNIDFILVGNLNNDFELFLSANQFNYTLINLKGWPSYFSCIKHITKIIRLNKPDIVHTHLTSANILGLTAARIAGIRCRVFTEHTGQLLQQGLKTRFYNYIKLKFAVYAVAITSTVKKTLIGQNFKKENIAIIHHGFNIKRFQNNNVLEVNRLKEKYNPTKRRPVIGVIARNVEMKGIQYIIPAFKKICIEYPNALLCLFSFSENEKYSVYLNNMLADLDSKSYLKIEFENNVYDMYQLFDIFVHIPTYPLYEAFGQVYVESLASSIPSVFTLSGIANDFIINEENALVVGYKNADQVYYAIKRLIEDKALKNKLVLRGVESVKNAFDFERYIDNLNDFYKKIKKQETLPYLEIKSNN